ncbi:protein abrupt-like isoform X3 [Ostrinia nubilalis]|uniref:protein abrupt-like isoform X3 n=1 Tax=Ostrinia nubilalis TaxID=29057 RepID=UPI0030826493
MSLQFCVSSDSFKTSISNGLSCFQQREEFVDMTLAADGHFVKVHQVVVSLASPYLKELILSAPCPHPVVFLNKISYPILCYILEFIYSGEVMVHKESLPELMEAGKELHIIGLQDMEILQDKLETNMEQNNASTLVEKLQQFKSQTGHKSNISITSDSISNTNEVRFDEKICDPFEEVENDHLSEENNTKYKQTSSNQDTVSLTLGPSHNNSAATSNFDCKTVQYTLSNQGSLQLILNRFIYYLRYCRKKSDRPMRTWRCVDYMRNKCPALVTTRDDIVVQRVSAHKHGFHDKQIMKKVKLGTIFTAIRDAEKKGLEQKNKTDDH